MASNPFDPPAISGDRAARSAIHDVNTYSDSLVREHAEAVTSGNLRDKRRFNQTRLQLEAALNHLRTISDFSNPFTSRITNALTKGQEILSNFDPYDILAAVRVPFDNLPPPGARPRHQNVGTGSVIAQPTHPVIPEGGRASISVVPSFATLVTLVTCF